MFHVKQSLCLTGFICWINLIREVLLVYSISVFNTKQIKGIDPLEVLAAVTSSNYHTLCDQYGLDQALIEPTLLHLNVMVESQESLGYFILEYRPQGRRPIFIHLLNPSDIELEKLKRLWNDAPQAIRKKLSGIKQIVRIELEEDQLRDLGLLLGYELARWAAESGDGVVQGLDGNWYRLNQHKAFLPLV
jgi:hypothetical protein